MARLNSAEREFCRMGILPKNEDWTSDEGEPELCRMGILPKGILPNGNCAENGLPGILPNSRYSILT